MKIFNLSEITQAISLEVDLKDLISSQKTAFIDFSSGLYEVPPPMQFVFPQYHSDCHVKGGYKQGSKNLVIKIANGSPLGNSGILLIFAADTGALKFILHDQGFLTTLRTAIAGLIISTLIPWNFQNIGIIGSGSLAEMLYKLVRIKYPHMKTMVYARNKSKAEKITDEICNSAEELITKCDVIFTATASTHPIIQNMTKGSNKAIIALGSDDTHKSELSPDVFKKSDIIIVDSKSQAKKFGDVAKALTSGIIAPDSLIELGDVLKSGISAGAQIIVADFSGIGAQDVALSEFILPKFST